MDDTARDRLAELAALQNGLLSAWPTLKPDLEKRRRMLVAQLVLANNDETRGRIKELDELLGMPERLQQEAENLTAPKQEEGELP